MRFFRRKPHPERDDESLEQLEDSPEYRAAQEQVNRAPGPPPSSSPYWDTITGGHPGLVNVPEEEDAPPGA